MSGRDALTRPGRWVIKIGTAVLTRDGLGLDDLIMARWATQITALLARGYEIVLVSSGSVAEGVIRLGWRQRPEEIHLLQAAAAVGQMGLVQAWETCFRQSGRHTAQVLLTHDDLADRTRYLNARRTLQSLLKLGVIPVVNENDTVVTDEIRFGDNDTLGALVANLVEADALVILTDQDGVFERDPRLVADARLVPELPADDASLDAMAGAGGVLGRGGMVTKIRAARLASRSGTHTVVCNGRSPEGLEQLALGESVGTLLYARSERIAARKQWLAGQLRASGKLTLDAGAARVLRQGGKSLLPIGVTGVEGRFQRGDLVSCHDPDGVELARGLVNYNAEEARRIIGQPSRQIGEILGYCDDEELIHRNNLVLV